MRTMANFVVKEYGSPPDYSHCIAAIYIAAKLCEQLQNVAERHGARDCDNVVVLKAWASFVRDVLAAVLPGGNDLEQLVCTLREPRHMIAGEAPWDWYGTMLASLTSAKWLKKLFFLNSIVEDELGFTVVFGCLPAEWRARASIHFLNLGAQTLQIRS